MKLIYLPTNRKLKIYESMAKQLLQNHPEAYIRAELPEHWRVEMFDKSLEWARGVVEDGDFSDDLDWITNYDLSESGFKVDGFCSMKEGMQLPQISRAEFEYHIYIPWKASQRPNEAVKMQTELVKDLKAAESNEQLEMKDVNEKTESGFLRLNLYEIGNPATPYVKNYYNQQPIEVIDMMLSVYGKEAVKNFCLLNSFKYRMRAGHKDDALQDIEKAKWYEAKAKEIDGTPTT